MDAVKRKVAGLRCWSGPVHPQPLTGGITNLNFTVDDAGRRYVVRVGDDIPVHQVMRFNELAAPPQRPAYRPKSCIMSPARLCSRLLTARP